VDVKDDAGKTPLDVVRGEGGGNAPSRQDIVALLAGAASGRN